MAGQLIAFEGLDQSGKQTQAELLRDRLKAGGPQGAARLVSRLRHVDRRRDRAGAAGRARVRPRRHAAALHRQSLRAEARSAALARRRADPRVRSLHGVEHRLRRGAGARSRLAHRPCSSSCRRPALTILLDIAPETAVTRKAVDRDRYERDLALQARVRESYHRQAAAADWIRARRRARQGRDRRRRVQRGRSHDSRCRKRAHLPDARRLQRPRARLERRAGRAHIVDQHDDRAAERRRAPRDAANAPRTLPWRWAAGRLACAARGPHAPQRAHDAAARVPREVGRLIESALAPPRRVERHRHDGVGAGEHVGARVRASARRADAPAIAGRRTSARGRSRAARRRRRRSRARRSTRREPRRQRAQRADGRLTVRQVGSGSPQRVAERRCERTESSASRTRRPGPRVGWSSSVRTRRRRRRRDARTTRRASCVTRGRPDGSAAGSDGLGVAPEAFEPVEQPRLRREDVDDEIEVVEQDPFGSVVAFDVRRLDPLRRAAPRSTASAIARICRGLVPEQMTKKSVKPAAFRRSRTTRSAAFLSSAAWIAVSMSCGRRADFVVFGVCQSWPCNLPAAGFGASSMPRRPGIIGE